MYNQTLEWEALLEEAFLEVENDKFDNARAKLLNSTYVARNLMKEYGEMAGNREEAILSLELEVVNTGKRSIIIGAIVSLVVIVLSLVIALIATSKISNPIKTVMERMKLIASGDLSMEPLVLKSMDEVGQLTLATDEMNGNMRHLLHQIKSVPNTVNSQSEALTQSANEVKSGSDQQQ